MSILSFLFWDSCNIKRKVKEVNPNTGVSETILKTIATNIKCKLDEEQAPTLSGNEIDSYYTTYTLFTYPNTDIKMGDIIEVAHFGDTYTFIASKPFKYQTHQEIKLEYKER